MYWFRKRVPKDVRARIGGPHEVKKSLGTKVAKEAQLLFREVEAAYEARWAQIRKGIQILDDRQCDAIAGEVYRDFFASFPANDRSVFVNHLFAGMRWRLEIVLDEIPPPRGWAPFMEPLTDIERVLGKRLTKILAERGIQVDNSTRNRLLWKSAQAALQASKKISNECNGDWRPDPDADRFPSVEVFETTSTSKFAAKYDVESLLKEVAEGWGQSTRRRWLRIIRDLASFAGASDDVTRITRAQVESWRDAALKSERVTALTFKRNDLAAVKAFFASVIALKALAITNPAQGVTVLAAKRQKARQMRGFYDSEAVTILKATLAPPSPRISRHLATARRWVPWICAYTGARVNEITQARAQDVKRIDGIWCIRITPEAGTEKTNCERDVPLHKHLIDQGFLDFVVTRKGAERLFAADSSVAATRPAEITGGKLAQWVRGLGVDDPAVAPNHGWRHRFKTETKNLMEERYADAIQGHVQKTQGRKYGAFPPKILAPHIAAIPTIDLGALRPLDCASLKGVVDG
jgi:integrase